MLLEIWLIILRHNQCERDDGISDNKQNISHHQILGVLVIDTVMVTNELNQHDTEDCQLFQILLWSTLVLVAKVFEFL